MQVRPGEMHVLKARMPLWVGPSSRELQVMLMCLPFNFEPWSPLFVRLPRRTPGYSAETTSRAVLLFGLPRGIETTIW